MINKALDLPFPEPEETYSNSDYLYEELEIPRTATGRLPRAQRTREGLEAEAIEDLGETGRRKPAAAGTRQPRTERPRTERPRKDQPRAAKRSDAAKSTEATKRSGEGGAAPARRRRRTRGGSHQQGGPMTDPGSKPVDPPA